MRLPNTEINMRLGDAIVQHCVQDMLFMVYVVADELSDRDGITERDRRDIGIVRENLKDVARLTLNDQFNAKFLSSVAKFEAEPKMEKRLL